jgi:hypothetical protein
MIKYYFIILIITLQDAWLRLKRTLRNWNTKFLGWYLAELPPGRDSILYASAVLQNFADKAPPVDLNVGKAPVEVDLNVGKINSTITSTITPATPPANLGPANSSVDTPAATTDRVNSPPPVLSPTHNIITCTKLLNHFLLHDEHRSCGTLIRWFRIIGMDITHIRIIYLREGILKSAFIDLYNEIDLRTNKIVDSIELKDLPGSDIITIVPDSLS